MQVYYSGFYVSENGTEFTLLDDVNFKVSSSLDTMEVELLDQASGNIPTNFRLTKKGISTIWNKRRRRIYFW